MSVAEPRLVTLGIQNLCHYKYHNISGATGIPGIGVAAFHRRPPNRKITTLKVLSYSQHSVPHRYSLPYDIFHLTYAKSDKVYIAASSDLALRVLTEEFNLIAVVPVGTFPTSLEVNSKDHELYVGEYGRIVTWHLQQNFYEPLVRGSLFQCPLKKYEYPFMMRYDENSGVLLVCTRRFIYLINTIKQDIVGGFISNDVEISSAAILPQLGYLVIGLKSGIIKIWKYQYHYLVHSFTAHTKTVTGLVAHPSSPSIISCSMDKTVCVWNVEYMAKMYSVQSEKELLGMCWDCPRIACYTKLGLMMWTVSEPLTLFASIYTTPIKIDRATPYPRVPRILALGEDESIRILSPASGEVITILFPMFTTDLLIDYTYSQVDNLLLVLLKTGSVLNFDTTYNPCLAKELWEPTVASQKINCFALCYVALSSKKVYALVFGGQVDGNIVLLFSSGHSLKMPCICFAHKWCITAITATCSLINSTQSNNIALITYEQEMEDILHIWGLSISEADGKVILQCCYSVLLDGNYLHKFLLTDYTLSIVLEKKRLAMLQIPRTAQKTKFFHLSKFPQLHHEPDDSHRASINSLLYCASLKTVITSSDDGVVKVWDLSNQLVADLDIGWPLSSVGIASEAGDLLISHQNVITKFSSNHFLPHEYTSRIRRNTVNDFSESVIPFNPNLKFWYDPSFVPSMALSQYKRRTQQEVNHPIVNSILSASTEVDSYPADSIYSIPNHFKVLMSDESDSNNQQFLEEKVDLNKCKFGTLKHICFLAARRSVLAQESYHSMHSRSSSTSEKPFKTCHKDRRMYSESVTLKSGTSRTNFKSKLHLDESAAAIPPVACDGFVPNSVIRSEILKYLEKCAIAKQATRYSVSSEGMPNFIDSHSYIVSSSKDDEDDSTVQKPYFFQDQNKWKKQRKTTLSLLNVGETLSNLFKVKSMNFMNSSFNNKKKKTVRISARSKSEKCMSKKYKNIKRLNQTPAKWRFECQLRKDILNESDRHPGSSVSTRNGSSQISTSSSRRSRKQNDVFQKMKLGKMLRAVQDVQKQQGKDAMELQKTQGGQRRSLFISSPPQKKESFQPIFDEGRSEVVQNVTGRELMATQVMQNVHGKSNSPRQTPDFLFEVPDSSEVKSDKSLLSKEKSQKEKYPVMKGILTEHGRHLVHLQVEEQICSPLFRRTTRAVDEKLFKQSKELHTVEVPATSSVYEELSRTLDSHECISENLKDILTILRILGREGVLKENEAQELSSKISDKLKVKETSRDVNLEKLNIPGENIQGGEHRKADEHIDSNKLEKNTGELEVLHHSEKSDHTMETDIHGITKIELVSNSSEIQKKDIKKKVSMSMTSMCKDQRSRRDAEESFEVQKSHVTIQSDLHKAVKSVGQRRRRRKKSKLSFSKPDSAVSHITSTGDFSTMEHDDIASMNKNEKKGTDDKEDSENISHKNLRKNTTCEELVALQEDLLQAYNTLSSTVGMSNDTGDLLPTGEELEIAHLPSTTKENNEAFDAVGLPKVTTRVPQECHFTSKGPEVISGTIIAAKRPPTVSNNRIENKIILRVPGKDFIVRGHNCLHTFSQLITVVSGLCKQEHDVDLVNTFLPFLLHKNEFIQKWAARSLETLVNIKSIEKLQQIHKSCNHFSDRRSSEGGYLKRQAVYLDHECSHTPITHLAKERTQHLSTKHIQSRFSLQGYKSIVELRDSSRRKSWMYKKAAQVPSVSRYTPIVDNLSSIANHIERSHIEEGKSSTSVSEKIEWSPLSKAKQNKETTVYLQKDKNSLKEPEHAKEEQNVIPLASIKGKWDSSRVQTKSEENASSHKFYPIYDTKIKTTILHRGAVESRMLEKIGQKARAFKVAFSSKQPIEPDVLPDNHTSSNSVLMECVIKVSHGLSEGVCVSDVNAVKAFSKHPTSIPSSEQILAAKEYRLFYKWTDLYPFISASNAYLLDV